MATNKKDNPSMEFPLQIARQYPAPLDKYSLFYSLEEAEDYAENSPLAYVGQLVSVINEEEGTVDIYKITIAGNMRELAKIEMPSDDMPKMNGTGSAGTSMTYARGDHVHPIPFGTCNSKEDQPIKDVTLPGFVLTKGAIIGVRFTRANLSYDAFTKLNVNSTGAVNIYCNGRWAYLPWNYNSTIEFLYDGYSWQIVGGYALADKPLGYVYISNNNTSPAEIFGGSWTAIKDRFIVGAGGSYTAGSTGGYKDAVVVSHNHLMVGGNADNWNQTASDRPNNALASYKSNSGDLSYELMAAPDGAWEKGTTSTVGESGANKNLPPYRAEYMWYRTA